MSPADPSPADERHTDPVVSVLAARRRLIAAREQLNTGVHDDRTLGQLGSDLGQLIHSATLTLSRVEELRREQAR